MKIFLSIYLALAAISLTFSQVSGSGLTDVKGYKYTSVIIGEQEWMSTNLNVDKFRNGEVIPEAKTKEEWIQAATNKQPAWCYFNYDLKNESKWGKLYNYYAIIDSRILAPEGWHIPSREEWMSLFNSPNNSTEQTAKKFNTTSGWAQQQNGTNSTGLSVCPSGRNYGEYFSFLANTEACFWSFPTNESNGADVLLVNSKNYELSPDRSYNSNYFEGGYSVRCVKGNPKNKEILNQSNQLSSKDWIDCSTSTHDIKIYREKVSFERAKEYKKNLGDGWMWAGSSVISKCVNLCKSFLTENTFWTGKEVYMSSDNIQRDNTNGGYIIDYDAVEVYYVDKDILNPEKKQGNYHSVIFVKEKTTNIESVKGSLSTAKQIGQIKVYPVPFSSSTFLAAQENCKKLGEGWRLPTLDELKQIKNSGIYTDYSSIEGNFFWSATKSCDGCYDSYFVYGFYNGNQVVQDIKSKYRYFAVYSPPSANDVKTWKFNKFEANIKIYGPMSFEDAQSYCLKTSDSGNRWRLPSQEEMGYISSNKLLLTDMIGKTFWTYSRKYIEGYGYGGDASFGTYKIGKDGEYNSVSELNQYTVKSGNYYFFMVK
jgi:uncharacterized protein (TIGR02145 family)